MRIENFIIVDNKYIFVVLILLHIFFKFNYKENII